MRTAESWSTRLRILCRRSTPRRSARRSSRAQRRVPPRSGKEPARQRAVIETRTAHDDRQPAARVDVTNGGGGVFGILRRRVLVRGLDDVDEVVGNAAALA